MNIKNISRIIIAVFVFWMIIISNQNIIKATEITAQTENWQNIQGDGVVLSLPTGYEGGNPSTEINEIASKLEAINPKYSNRFELIKQNSKPFVLLAFDTKNTKSGFITNVNIIKETKEEQITLEEYLDIAIEKLSNNYEIKEKEIISDRQKMGRIIAEFQGQETKVKQLFYSLKNEDNFYLITYSTTTEEFDKRLPNFEQSIQTFSEEVISNR